LIVDDALFMRAMIRKIVEGAQYEVAGEAENGALAVELYQSLQPDLVLMDVTMPVMSGLDAARAIKAANPSAAIIMCTALGQANVVQEAMSIGAKGFIIKPFEPSKVLENIGKVLQS
jgi:two-component system chemotaxis response regulator CheY